jgi:hypothetical protein
VDNPVAPAIESGTTSATPAGTSQAVPGASEFSWKGNLNADFANSPTMQKFPDTKEGFNEAVKSHLSLEQMLGHEKVPIPKDDKDTEGWNRLAKALGVPDKPDMYGLTDPEIPKEMEGLSFNKKQFSEISHSLKLTPGQTKQLWESYTGITKELYAQHLNAQKEQMTKITNQMRGEWGDAFETKVELGQMVINKFSPDADTNDFITAALVKDPRGIKFLARLGEQFAENKIGEFGYKNFSLTPDQAQTQIDEILNDPKHPYNNERANPAERERAIDVVNSLYAAIEKAKQGQA